MNRPQQMLAAITLIAAIGVVSFKVCNPAPIEFSNTDEARAKLSAHFSVQSRGKNEDFTISKTTLPEQQLIDVLWAHESITFPGIARVVPFDPDIVRDPPRWRRWGSVVVLGESAFLDEIEAQLR